MERGQPLECWQQRQEPGFLKRHSMSAPRAGGGTGLCGGHAYSRGARGHPGRVLLHRHAKIILRELVPATYGVLKILMGALTVKSGSASSELWQRKSWAHVQLKWLRTVPAYWQGAVKSLRLTWLLPCVHNVERGTGCRVVLIVSVAAWLRLTETHHPIFATCTHGSCEMASVDGCS